MFQGLGPNALVGAGNLLLIMERQVDYAVAATLKIQRERIRSIEAKPEAVQDFEEYIEVSILPDTIDLQSNIWANPICDFAGLFSKGDRCRHGVFP